MPIIVILLYTLLSWGKYTMFLIFFYNIIIWIKLYNSVKFVGGCSAIELTVICLWVVFSEIVLHVATISCVMPGFTVPY